MDRESLRTTTYRSFAQGMPLGQDQGNIPALMRRVADTIEEAQRVADIEVHEIVFAIEVSDDGDYPHFRVYFTMEED